jgi:hypothetical protein
MRLFTRYLWVKGRARVPYDPPGSVLQVSNCKADLTSAVASIQEW